MATIIKQNANYNLKVKSIKSIDNPTIQDKIGNGKITIIDADYISTANTVISSDLYNTMHGQQTMLKSPMASWAHPDSKHANSIILSPDNSKVNDAARSHFCGIYDRLKTRNDKNALCYGKPSIISCPFASNCVQFCYADAVESQYVASLRIHGHNYYMVYGQSISTIYDRIENGWDNTDKQYRLIRLNDTGDFISYNEIVAWNMFATNHPDVMVYGYTKNSAHMHKFLTNNSPADNFRISISSTNENDKTTDIYIDKMRNDFPEYTVVCEIIDTKARVIQFENLPYNNEEFYAILHNQDFKIQLHSENFETGTDEWKVNVMGKQLTDVYGLQVC